MKTEWNGRGHFTYGKQTIMQHPDVFSVFKPFLRKENFDTVIEIGTANGGFAVFLQEMANELSYKFITYDKNDITHKNSVFESLNIDFRVKNIWYDETIEEVSDIIKNGGKTLICCDGGNKKLEVNTFTPHLKSGDFIMAHDYAPDNEYFEKHIKGKVWNWAEIQDKYISESLTMLDKMYFDEFIEVVWFCAKKK